MTADAWMPFYPGSYLRKTMHLTRDQHGGYLLLLLACWDGGGSIPNDHNRLSGIVKASPAEWKKLAPVLLPFFEEEGDTLVNPRVRFEYEKAQKLSEARQASGRLGGRPAKPNLNTSTAKPIGLGIANQLGKLTETPSPSPSKEDSEANASVATATPSDDKAALWRDGLATLKAITGQQDGPTRKQIGTLLDAAGKDHALVLDLLRQAEAKAVDNPLPWIKAAIKARTSPQLPIADDYLGLDAWLATQETVMTKMQDGRMMPTINGFAPHILADVIVDAISDGGGQISPTPNWDALADWCNEDMFYRDGWKTAIARVAGRLDGAVMSMAVFNMALNGLRRQA